MPASAATTTTAQHQQMAREIQNADFAEEYFASLSAPAKRLIEDVVAVKEAYEDVWTGLNAEEHRKFSMKTLFVQTPFSATRDM